MSLCMGWLAVRLIPAENYKLLCEKLKVEARKAVSFLCLEQDRPCGSSALLLCGNCHAQGCLHGCRLLGSPQGPISALLTLLLCHLPAQVFLLGIQPKGTVGSGVDSHFAVCLGCFIWWSSCTGFQNFLLFSSGSCMFIQKANALQILLGGWKALFH